MDRGGRGMRRTRGGRPFIRGFYRGRKGSGRVMRSRSRTSCSKDRYGSYDNDHSDSHERSWDSPPGTDKDLSKEKHERENSSPTRNKWEKDDDANDKNDEHYKEKKDYYHDSKHYRRSTGYSYRGRRPYQNNYWDRSDRGGRHYSPQSQYRVRPYHTPPRHRRYSRSPDRRRSPSRYRSRSRTPSRSRRYSPKGRSPKRRSPSIRDSRRSKSPNECGQSTEKNQTINNSDDENNSDDFVEKLKASKGSKTPGRLNYAENSDDDDYWIEAEKNDTKDAKKSNRPDYSSIGSKTPGRQEIFDYSSKGSKTPGRQEIPDYSSKGSKTPGRQESFDYSKGSKTPGRQEIPDYSSKGSKTPGRQETSDYSSKGSKTPGRQELPNNDKDEYWVKSQTSHNMPSTKNVYSSSWDDSPIREKSVPSKVPKTPGRKDYSSKDNDDYWINSSSNDSKKDRSSNDLYSKKTINKDSSIMYVQELSSSDSEPKKPSKRPRSVSLTNSDKSDTPPLNTEPSKKVGTRYSQASTRVSNTVLKEPPPPSIPATSSSLPVYNSQWPGLQNVSSPYSSTVNYSQPQTSQFTAYQQQPQVPVQNSQWYQPGYQQYGTSFQQFQKYDQKSVYSQPVHSNLEPVEGYQSTNQGLYNIDLKQVVDITKPPPTITPITTTVSASPDTQTKNSQDNIFEMQREVYTTKLFSLKKELETLQIQYDTFKSDNSDGRHNNELKKNRKAQDDVNGKIKGVNNILEVVNTMIPKDSLKDIKKVEQKKITTESESLKTIHQEESTTIHKHRRQSISSSSSVEVKKKKIKPIKSKKTLKVQSSDEDEKINSKKSYKSKEYIDTNKKKTCFEKLPQFNYIYCDSCIHWCQPCNIFPKTAKEYLTHLHSDSHKTTLEELNVVELPWHDTLTEPTQPGRNAELPNKRVPIKGLEFFIGTSAWYCKLCDTWIGDLHCASAHFKSKTHNDLYAELMEKEPTWEIDWLTKRTRAFEKCFSQTNMVKYDEIKENKTKGNVTESKIERSFFEKEPKRDKEKEKLRERDRDRDKDRYKKESSRKNIDLKSQLSPDKESNDTNNVSISDWMKPVDLPVEKSMITLKESVQKSKDKLNKNKIEEIDNFKSNISTTTNNHVIKKKTEEPKLTTVHDKKDESFNSSHRNKIKLPFIGKMPFAKPITKKTNSIKDIPNFTVETKVDEPKDNHMDSVTFQKMFIEKMISAVNDKKIEKQILPVDMDIDDDNENNTILSSTDSTEVQLNSMQTGNQMHQIYNQPHSNILPQDLSTALNMIFPCNETSVNTSINSQIHNPLINQHFNMSYDVTNNSNLNSPERKKKKNAPSQRKRRHMKKIMGKEDSNKDENDEDDNSETAIIQGPKEETIRKSNGNESEGDELAMLGIDAEDMAAQYY